MKILNKRACGILLHITSLPSKYGIGDIGSTADRFVDFLKNSCQSFWQILPLNPTSISGGNSPYMSSSAFAGNTLVISPDKLYEEGLLKKADIEHALKPDNRKTKKSIDFMRSTIMKNKILDTAFINFSSKRKGHRQEFDDFCKQNNKKWLHDHAIFTVFKKYFRKKYDISSWKDWPETIKNRNENEIKILEEELGEEIQKEKFFQFLFFGQWKELKKKANKNGIQIIGDMPIYVDYESSDVWSNPEIFKLDKNKSPEFVAGVPPDYYSSKGQLWKNPVYNWKKIEETGFLWWIQRIEWNMQLFDLLRIDHFRGLVAYWEVPAGDRTAVKGRWVKARPEGLFKALESGLKRLPLIAEDLGVITRDVTGVMDKFGFPGIRVIQFAFGRDFPESGHLPHNYARNCIVYTGTHDNNTLRGWIKNDAKIFEKKNLSLYTGKEINQTNINKEMIRLIMGSVAAIVIVPVQDILGLGPESRMNHPSTARGNWQWQMDGDMLSADTSKYLAEISYIYQRAGS